MRKIGTTTNIVAKLDGLRDCLKLSLQRNQIPFAVEMDALSIIHMLHNTSEHSAHFSSNYRQMLHNTSAHNALFSIESERDCEPTHRKQHLRIVLPLLSFVRYMYLKNNTIPVLLSYTLFLDVEANYHKI